MNEEIDDQDFHYDFTAASEWEMFMFRLEEIIREWKIPQLKRGPLLKKGELSTGKWETKTEIINFADVEFRLTRHRLLVDSSDDISSPLDEENEECKSQVLEDIMRFEHDFPPHSMDNGTHQPHPLAVWYGIRDFLIISAWSGISSYSESKVKILLSSIYVAVNNSNCPIPLFVQVHDSAEHYYLGVCEARGLRTEFEMIHLKRTPPHCKYLTGLLNVFKSKITSAMSTEPVTISVQFTYILTDWTSNKWTQEPPDFDFLNGHTLGVKDLGKLPFGATFDPVSELQLYARWPQLTEASVVDSESYSDLEPCRAPEWSVGVRMVERPNCLLGEHFDEFLQFCLCQSTARDLLGDIIDVATAENINLSSSLCAITESRVPTISKVIRKAKLQHQQSKGSYRDAPLSHDYLLPILYFLFPDADSKLENPYPENISSHSNSDNRQSEEQLLNIKSAPVDSLVWRLAVVMSHVVHTLGGVRAAAYLWFEFTQEMRYRWEKCILIPGVAPGDPDLRTCLLHQKLQMLNRCIERRMAREREARAGSVDADDTDTESDEEFFDCSADAPVGGLGGGSGDRPRQRHSLWNRPAGRLSRHPQLRLLRTGEPLYVPATQAHTPKTEDQQQQDEDVLVQLGTDERAAQLRARIMSAALLSDMESFKAANPGAILEDFIRWYSPPDWKEEDGVDEFGQKKGCLSVRMQLKGNPWVEAWEAAKPVPARRQKRLFDDTREAEKVLHWLEAARPADVGRLLLPPLAHAAVQKPDEVIVKVHAASVNPIDVAMLGGYGSVLLNKMRQVESCDFSTPIIEFPLTLGRDFCGTVEYKGLGVRHVSVGDEVWGVLPPHRQGSHSQRIVAPSSLVQRKPRNLNRIEAASLLYTGVTAWSALKISGDLFLLPAHGRRVLVLGGSGGVGSVAVQLLKAWGTQVVATCATDAVPLVESLGADVVIDYTNPDAEMFIKKAGKYDIILDAAGLGADPGPGYADCLKSLSLSKYITLRSPLLKNVDELGIFGGMLKNIAELVVPNVRTGLSNPTSSVRWGFFVPSADAITEIGTLVGLGKIIPLVEKVYPFEEIPAAFDRMKSGHLRGKIVVDMDYTKPQSEEVVKSEE